ncbi:MAG: hypothetical protein ACXAEN_19815 [Candidatus Thorarchaeota archaeon]|jgi:hypothetical protein
MVYKLEHYIEQAEKMIKADENKNRANNKIDDMDHVYWDPQEELRNIDWFRAVPSTDPHDAITAGVRVLSALEEDVTLQPLAANVETKKSANEREKILKWAMDEANQRRQGTVQRSVVRSALKYDEVAAQVIDLDYQIKNKEGFGADTKREKAARRYGRYVVNTYHPNDVHVEHSNLMPEAVLLAQVRTAKDVMREWGKAASKLKKAADNDESVELFDYMDYDVHVVWTQNKQGGDEVEIMREEHNLPFLPWVARVGGDIMERKQEHRRRPLLYPIVNSGMWETQNIVKSIRVSEVIRNFGYPQTKEEGPMPIDGRSTEINTGTDAGLTVDVTPGNTLTALPQPQMDPALREVDDMIQSATSKSTVANILQGGDVAPGTAFATLNLATQTAVGALKPGKELAEHALADIYELFLLWAHYTKSDIIGYGKGKEDKGQQYTIKWSEIDPEKIYLSVDLKPDVPLDRQQRANTAMMMVQAGIYSKERAMQDMGITDPETVMKEVTFDQLFQAQIANIIQRQQLDAQMEAQQQAQEQQLAMETMQNQMAGAPGGNGFNPALGGEPPAEAAPGATFEGVTGEDRQGNEAPFGMGGF